MRATGYLIKRNILLYIRDRTAVFFSLLSMVIVIGLMMLFLGNMNRDNIVDLLNHYGGVRDKKLDLQNATNLIQAWTIGGLLVVNSLTVSLTMIGLMVEDEAKNRIASFYVAPMNRSIIAIGYVTAAMIMAGFMCILTLLIAQSYLYITGSFVFTIGQIGRILCLIVANVFVYSSILFLAALFVRSVSAWSALGTIMGTLVGFIGAIYLPMGMLPKAVQNVLKCLPVLHGTSLMQRVCTKFVLEKTFFGLPKEVSSEYQLYMGITVEYKEKFFSTGFQIAYLLLCGIIALSISSILLKKRTLKER
ncbi:ABC-2 family transporter [Lachnotalea glycerini]|jgi:multidrug/hemolysin transport system permease protein|uniref:ABC transporter permease n=1 Tax=Lachnotalea glycerini TaxID=1763509 RepID=A0A255IRA4_9FIRM|nr:ABC transporter permease [Lachnotalea glycerini]PXV86015.1 ABC-2 family transporter [Lachnotalea glycerini]RDY30735.1 ABC transporter permease [Lachnotalea glycerini]